MLSVINNFIKISETWQWQKVDENGRFLSFSSCRYFISLINVLNRFLILIVSPYTLTQYAHDECFLVGLKIVLIHRDVDIPT